ncbi:MAG: hypothetical protein AAFQ11_08915, partial [Pseudomonadota bacterium]
FASVGDVTTGCFVPLTIPNVPATGVFAYEPGGYFGLAMPDTFFFKRLSRARLGPNSELER